MKRLPRSEHCATYRELLEAAQHDVGAEDSALNRVLGIVQALASDMGIMEMEVPDSDALLQQVLTKPTPEAAAPERPRRRHRVHIVNVTLSESTNLEGEASTTLVAVDRLGRMWVRYLVESTGKGWSQWYRMARPRLDAPSAEE